MSSMDATSFAAANAVSQNYASLGPKILAVGRDPSPETVSTMNQAEIQTEFSMEVFKKTMDTEESIGTQMAQLIGQSNSAVDIYA